MPMLEDTTDTNGTTNLQNTIWAEAEAETVNKFCRFSSAGRATDL